MRHSASESQDCTVAVGKVTEMTTGVCGAANQRAEIAWSPSREEGGLMKSWQLREEEAVTVPRVRGVTVADVLAMVLLAVLSQVPQVNIGARDSGEVSLVN